MPIFGPSHFTVASASHYVTSVLPPGLDPEDELANQRQLLNQRWWQWETPTFRWFEDYILA